MNTSRIVFFLEICYARFFSKSALNEHNGSFQDSGESYKLVFLNLKTAV